MSNFLITQGNSGTYVVGPYCWPYPNITGFETFPLHGRNPQILPMDYDDNPSVLWKPQQNASKKLKSISNFDWNKSLVNTGDKVVYMASNPFDWVCAMFNVNKKPGKGDFLISQTRFNEGNWEYFLDKEQLDIDYYLTNMSKDEFGFKEHIENFINYDERHYDLLFFKYESLEKYGMDVILDFWNLENNNTFKWRKRSNSWKNLSDKTKKLLEDKYGDVMEWFDSLPEYKIYSKQ